MRILRDTQIPHSHLYYRVFSKGKGGERGFAARFPPCLEKKVARKEATNRTGEEKAGKEERRARTPKKEGGSALCRRNLAHVFVSPPQLPVVRDPPSRQAVKVSSKEWRVDVAKHHLGATIIHVRRGAQGGRRVVIQGGEGCRCHGTPPSPSLLKTPPDVSPLFGRGADGITLSWGGELRGPDGAGCSVQGVVTLDCSG